MGRFAFVFILVCACSHPHSTSHDSDANGVDDAAAFALDLGSMHLLQIGVAATIAPMTSATIASCSISPGLPDGLVLDGDCTIHGTPTSVAYAQSYAVTATAGGKDTTATVTIAVYDPNVPVHVRQYNDDVHMPYGLGSSLWGTAPYQSYLDVLGPFSDLRLVNAGYPSAALVSQIHAAGIKAMHYTYPLAGASNEPVYNYYLAHDPGDESVFAHNCNGSVLADRVYVREGVAEAVYDPASPQTRSMYGAYVHSSSTALGFDYVMADSVAVLWNTATANNVLDASNKPCNNATHTGYDRPKFVADTLAYIQQSDVPVLYNSAHDVYDMAADPVTHVLLPDEVLGFDHGTGILGGRMEDCYFDKWHGGSGSTVSMDATWTREANIELKIVRDGKMLACMQVDDYKNVPTGLIPIFADTALGQSIRMYTAASMLLTYDPATTTVWHWMFPRSPAASGAPSPTNPAGSGIPLFAETNFVPLDPVRAPPLTIDGLQQTGGAYGREYRHCYLAGAFVGACAIVVNPSSTASAPFPYSGYSATLALDGGGLLDGGTARIDTHAPAASLAPATAVIAIAPQPMPPASIRYAAPAAHYAQHQAIYANIPLATGGIASTYTVSPTLPAGLALDAHSGAITGTPSVAAPAATYTVTASNALGSTSTHVSIAIDAAMSVSYPSSSYAFAKGAAIADVTPAHSGPSVVVWSSDPALPAGLHLDATTGVISGTPTTTSSGTYVIYAFGAEVQSRGHATATVAITVQ